MDFKNNKNSKTLMEKSEQYRDMKMARRFQPPVLSLPRGSNVSSMSQDSHVRGPGPLCLLGVVETGEVAAPGGGSLLPGLAPSGQGHVCAHTPWTAWSVTGPDPSARRGLSAARPACAPASVVGAGCGPS